MAFVQEKKCKIAVLYFYLIFTLHKSLSSLSFICFLVAKKLKIAHLLWHKCAVHTTFYCTYDWLIYVLSVVFLNHVFNVSEYMSMYEWMDRWMDG